MRFRFHRELVALALIVSAAAVSACGETTDSVTGPASPQDSGAATAQTPASPSDTGAAGASSDDATTAAPAAAPAKMKQLRFSGNGGKKVRVKVPDDGTLYWIGDGQLFTVTTQDFDVLVNSQGTKGDTAIDAGDYVF